MLLYVLKSFWIFLQFYHRSSAYFAANVTWPLWLAATSPYFLQGIASWRRCGLNYSGLARNTCLFFVILVIHFRPCNLIVLRSTILWYDMIGLFHEDSYNDHNDRNVVLDWLTEEYICKHVLTLYRKTFFSVYGRIVFYYQTA